MKTITEDSILVKEYISGNEKSFGNFNPQTLRQN